MRLFVEYASKSSKRLRIDTSDYRTDSTTVRQIKEKTEDFFGIDLRQRDDVKLVLVYAGCELKEEWVLSEMAIPTCSTLKAELQSILDPDFYCHVSFKKERVVLYQTGLDPKKSTVLDLRITLSNLVGLPLSIFRLKTMTDVCMYDHYILRDYDLVKYSEFIMETWNEWDSFLQNCVKGLTRQIMDGLNEDEFIKQFQQRVALYIAAFYGNQELTTTMIKIGIRPDRPVGEHPCRQWCQKSNPIFMQTKKSKDRLEMENLKCPIHVAVLSGQLKIIMQMYTLTSIHTLQKLDGYGMPPWRLALHNQHRAGSIKHKQQQEVARYLAARTFERKINLSDTFKVSIPFYCKLITWAEHAREAVSLRNGLLKNSKKNSMLRTGLLGNKVLIDGFNNDFKDYQNAYDRLRDKYNYYYFIDEEEKEMRASNIDFKIKKKKRPAPKKLITQPSDYSEIGAKVESWSDFSQLKKQSSLDSTSSILTTYRGPISIISSTTGPLQKQETSELSPKNSPRLPRRQPILTQRSSINHQSSFQKQESLVCSSVISSQETISPLYSFGGKKREFVKQQSLVNSSFNWNQMGSQLETVDKLPSLNSESLIFKSPNRGQLNHQHSLNSTSLLTSRSQMGAKSRQAPMLNRSMMGRTFDTNYGGKTSEERARDSYELATQFKSKSWLKQVRIGSQIALNDFRRSLNSTSTESP